MLALLWLFGNSEDRGAVVATAIACLIGLTAAFALSLIATPRPFMDGPALNYLDHIRDRSFLSDHATLLFAIAFAFWVHRPASLPSLWVPALALALAVGWARVFLGAHYPRDIAGRPRGGPRDRRHRDPARQGGYRLDLDACGPAARTARRQGAALRAKSSSTGRTAAMMPAPMTRDDAPVGRGRGRSRPNSAG